MELSGRYLIPAPRDKVWEALNDPQVLRACIPGCQELTKIADGELSAKVTVKVGAIQAPFGGRIALSDVDPPRAYTLSGQGQGGAAGFARGSARIKLDDHGVDTLLCYEARIDVGGKLVGVGNRLLAGVATQNADEFFARFNKIASGMAPRRSGLEAAVPSRGGAEIEAGLPLDAAPSLPLAGEPPSVAALAPRSQVAVGEERPLEAAGARTTGTSTGVLAAGAAAFIFILLLLFW